MVSTSSGLILLSASPLSDPPHSPAAPRLSPMPVRLVLSNGTPLITIRGEPEPVILGKPLNRILAVPPGPLLVPLTLKPATWPLSELPILVSLALFIKLASTVVTEYPSFLDSFVIPRAVTTTSPSSCPDSSKLILTVLSAVPTETVLGANPTEEISSWRFPDGTCNTN